MTPTLRKLVRELLREADERHERILALNDEINELIRLETPIWDAIDAVDNPGTNRDDWDRLGQLHGELEQIARQIRIRVQQRDALNQELTGYTPRWRRGS
jgi:hypothetical protein